MENFDGAYIKFVSPDLTYTGGSNNVKHGLEELKVFKKIAQLKKRQINEQLRIMRDQHKDDMISRGPASQGFFALAGRGTKFGSLARTLGSISRTYHRQVNNSRLTPLEDEKMVIEAVLVAADKMEIALKKELILPGSVIQQKEEVSKKETTCCDQYLTTKKLWCPCCGAHLKKLRQQIG